MARLSSASADQPRKRGRPAKHQSPADEGSSVKRTISPTAETPQKKRTRRVLIDGSDEAVIVEEAEQSISQAQNADTIIIDSQSTTTTSRGHRRHSEPPVPAQDGEQENVAYPDLSSTQPLSGLTPHLNRVGARFTNTRRSRMSMPAQLHAERIDEVDGQRIQYAPLTAVLDNRTRRRLRRSHLSQEVQEYEDHQKQDKKVLLELRRQLRAQDNKIKELEYQLEARRLGDIDMTDDHARQVEEELEAARQQIDVLRASSVYIGEDRDLNSIDDLGESDVENNDLMLVNPEELNMSQDLDFIATPTGKYASRVLELSSQMTFESLPELSQLTHDTLTEEDQSTVPETITDQAIERYERELQHYTRLLAQSQGALRVITLELQNLHFLEAGSSSNDVLTELRHGFDLLRAEIDKFFPNTTTGLTNQEVLRKVPELFSGVFFELREKLTLVTTSQKTEILLRRQYEGVLDLLGESENRIGELERQVDATVKSNEETQQNAIKLEERIDALSALARENDAEIKEKNAQLHDLCDERSEQDHNIMRLQESLSGYQQELKQMSQTVTDLETEHHDTIVRMEQEHAGVVVGLQEQIGVEQEARELAEQDAEQKDNYITELEDRIGRMEADVETITIEMTRLRERLTEECQGRETAETELAEQVEIVYRHSNTIENLKETVAELEDKLEELRTNLAAEKAQREQSEADLDEANDKIEDLNDRIRNAGVQANELRSKLFQVQQEKEQVINELEEQAREREEDLTEQLAIETQNRDDLQQKILNLEKHVSVLQTHLTEAENEVNNLQEAKTKAEHDRDLQVERLDQRMDIMKGEYTTLEESTQNTITGLQIEVDSLKDQIEQQQNEIQQLRQTLEYKEVTFEDATIALQETIKDLEQDLADERAEKENYSRENASLSQRVEDEANELLNMSDAHSKELELLKFQLASYEANALKIKSDSEQRQDEYEAQLEEKTLEIKELQILSTARVETITILEGQIAELKHRFAAQEEDTRVTVDGLLLSQRQLQEQNDGLAAALKKRNAETLEAVMKMKVEGVTVKTQNVDLRKVVAGKVVKSSEKVKVGKRGRKVTSKRQWDSGFGADDKIEDGEPQMEEVAV